MRFRAIIVSIFTFWGIFCVISLVLEPFLCQFSDFESFFTIFRFWAILVSIFRFEPFCVNLKDFEPIFVLFLCLFSDLSHFYVNFQILSHFSQFLDFELFWFDFQIWAFSCQFKRFRGIFCAISMSFFRFGSFLCQFSDFEPTCLSDWKRAKYRFSRNLTFLNNFFVKKRCLGLRFVGSGTIGSGSWISVFNTFLHSTKYQHVRTFSQTNAINDF